VLAAGFNPGQTPQAVAIIVGVHSSNIGNATNLTCSIRKNGVEIGRQSVSHAGRYSEVNTFIFSDPYPTPGYSTYQVLLGNDYFKGGPIRMNRMTAIITATLR
jgi:hypothetical protein